MGNEKSASTNQEFKGIRALLWPIHNFELKKFLPMGLMMMCILFVYTLVRDLKDTLMVSSATGGGAETLGFVKLYGVTPSAILFMIIFVRLANVLNQEKLFYVIVSFFLAFFATFGFIIYPMRGILHLSQETIGTLQQSMPHLHWVWPIIGNWSYALFYILSELWGSVVLTALFWQFANRITKVKEAKRFYSLFGFIGNFALLMSGALIVYSANSAKKAAELGLNGDTFGQNLRIQMAAVIGAGLLLIYVFRWMQKNVLTDPRLYSPDEVAKKKAKLQLGVWESTKMIFKSPYLLKIAMLMIGYGISINLIECIWKGQIKLQYPDQNDFNALMGKLSLTTGLLTITVMLIGANLLRLFSWRTVALITPVFLLVTGFMFFGVIMYENAHGLSANLLGVTVLFMAVVVGLIQDAFTKGVKYSLFDSTMQMAYIPLDPEAKTKGQAAVSVLGGRGGKAGGAVIQSSLLLTVGGGVSLASMVGVLSTIVFAVVIIWIAAVVGLGKQFEILTKDQQKEGKSKD